MLGNLFNLVGNYHSLSNLRVSTESGEQPDLLPLMICSQHARWARETFTSS